MRIIVKKETNGRIGRRDYCRSVEIVKSFDSYKEAYAFLDAKKLELTGPGFEGHYYGGDRDFYITLKSERIDCLLHFWWEQEQEDLGTTTFSLNKVEDERLHKFVEEHRKHGKSGSAGEFVRVFFCPTLLGTTVNAQCLVCGAVENLTDFDSW
ncbi:MAG: hypothetical protein J5374_01530 [Bacteroidales bacterium]|nr:hypothetical protein [Bacteroidales bacterium]